MQSESLVREKQTDDLLVALERRERELNQRIRLRDEKHLREQRHLQRRLADFETLTKSNEDKCTALTKDLQKKQCLVLSLQEELDRISDKALRETRENDLYKRMQENQLKRGCKRISSFTDLASIDLDTNFENLNHGDLIEKCFNLRNRFEKAVLEIRVLKQELREAFKNYDKLELKNINLHSSLEAAHQEAEAHSALMAARLQDLTNKLLTAEKQARNLKSKLQDSREKRRSLSLKGRESISINKEVEDKVNELEAKILVLEKSRCKRKHKRERSTDRTSPVDDRSSPVILKLLPYAIH